MGSGAFTLVWPQSDGVCPRNPPRSRSWDGQVLEASFEADLERVQSIISGAEGEAADEESAEEEEEGGEPLVVELTATTDDVSRTIEAPVVTVVESKSLFPKP